MLFTESLEIQRELVYTATSLRRWVLTKALVTRLPAGLVCGKYYSWQSIGQTLGALAVTNEILLTLEN